MARYVTRVPTPWTPDDAFDYLATFANAVHWDPQVKAASTVTGGPVGLGTRFRLTVTLGGRPLVLDYLIVAYERPTLVTLSAEHRLVRSTDRISVEPRPGGAEVLYQADLAVPGLGRLVDPLLQRWFDGAGDRAAAGLRRVLA